MDWKALLVCWDTEHHQESENDSLMIRQNGQCVLDVGAPRHFVAPPPDERHDTGGLHLLAGDVEVLTVRPSKASWRARGSGLRAQGSKPIGKTKQTTNTKEVKAKDTVVRQILSTGQLSTSGRPVIYLSRYHN